MSGGPLRAGAAYSGKLPRASGFNTIAAREAQFPAGGGATWWLDDEFDVFSFISAAGPLQNIPAGTLPNRTFFAPFDWPQSRMLLRRPRVVRVLVPNVRFHANYPGDPQLTLTGTASGFPFQDYVLGDRLFHTVAPAVEASLAGTGILFALHQPWHVDTPLGTDRFLRALAPVVDDDFLASDVLNLVFLWESESLQTALGDFVVKPWGTDGTPAYGEYDAGTGVYTGPSPAFAADTPAIVAAYPRFPRYRTVLYDCDPGDQTLVPGDDDGLIALYALARSNASALLGDVATSLSAAGVEYGGHFDPLTDGGSGIVALVAAHFGL